MKQAIPTADQPIITQSITTPATMVGQWVKSIVTITKSASGP